MTQKQSLTLTLSGDKFHVSDVSGFSVLVPTDINGLRLLKEMLKAKEHDPSGKIGTFSKPTQEMVDKFLRNQQLEKENKRKEDLKEIATIF